MTDILKKISTNTIKKIFVIVYPPYGEQDLSWFDIKFGICLDNYSNSLITIGTDMDDIWTPFIKIEKIPTGFYNEFEFEKRMNLWMKKDINSEFIFEYFDFTNSVYFLDIIDKKIIDIEYIKIEGISEPFGLKFIFENDYIISYPSENGSRFETKFFNHCNKLVHFEHLGKVIFETI
jgi:hypothetical protein